jgi:hypothetical protein
MNTFTKIARILPRKSTTAFLNAAVTVGRAITGVASRAEPGPAVLLDFRQTYAGPTSRIFSSQPFSRRQQLQPATHSALA